MWHHSGQPRGFGSCRPWIETLDNLIIRVLDILIAVRDEYRLDIENSFMVQVILLCLQVCEAFIAGWDRSLFFLSFLGFFEPLELRTQLESRAGSLI